MSKSKKEIEKIKPGQIYSLQGLGLWFDYLGKNKSAFNYADITFVVEKVEEHRLTGTLYIGRNCIDKDYLCGGGGTQIPPGVYREITINERKISSRAGGKRLPNDSGPPSHEHSETQDVGSIEKIWEWLMTPVKISVF